jgi:hypothetical protein
LHLELHVDGTDLTSLHLLHGLADVFRTARVTCRSFAFKLGLGLTSIQYKGSKTHLQSGNSDPEWLKKQSISQVQQAYSGFSECLLK